MGGLSGNLTDSYSWEKTCEVVFENLESDPTIYEEAIGNSDSNHWVKAIKAKMESIDSN